MSEIKPRASVDPLEQLLGEMQPYLSRLFWRFHIPEVDAEDLLQNSLLSLVSHRSTILNERAWLQGAVRHQCQLYWRQRRRRLYEALDGAILESLARPLAPEQEHRQLRHDLTTTLAKLPVRCRNIFRLRYGLGCEPNEVATKLGYKESSMHKITARCLSALAVTFGNGVCRGA